jgi:hypothetical protein
MLGHWLYHWFYLDFYVPVWPNLAAEVAVTGFIWSKLHAMHKLHKQHFDWHKGKDQDA